MPRLQAAAAGALMTFCDPRYMRAEWLYAPAPQGLTVRGGAGRGGAVGAALLEALCELVRDSPSVVVREEALTAVGCVAQVRRLGRDVCVWGEFLAFCGHGTIDIVSPPSRDEGQRAFAGQGSQSPSAKCRDVVGGGEERGCTHDHDAIVIRM